jgi:large subunit ribosomal protein L6
MSRIGKLPITVPSGVNVAIAEASVSVKGPKGELSQHILANVVELKLEDGVLVVSRKSEDKPGRSAHGLTRTLINNMIEGVTNGYSHPVVYKAPDGIAFAVEGTNKVHVDGIDKQKVGQVAAEIRDLRPPEPYKGKGVRYEGEVVRKKLGKAGKAGKK